MIEDTLIMACPQTKGGRVGGCSKKSIIVDTKEQAVHREYPRAALNNLINEQQIFSGIKYYQKDSLKDFCLKKCSIM
jgi:hypothetical protein